MKATSTEIDSHEAAARELQDSQRGVNIQAYYDALNTASINVKKFSEFSVSRSFG